MEEEIIWVSKTELKQDMLELQVLGEELVKLKPAILEQFPLDDLLRDTIADAQRFKGEAKRRQLQYLGKVMRHVDPEPIQAALDKYNNKHAQSTQALHKLELLRETLIEQGDSAINALIEKYPHADRQHMRQLVRQANKEKSQNKPPKASREIFQYLKELSDEL